MKAFFDTSVLVATVTDQLPTHAAALACFLRYTRQRGSTYTSAHVLAECYATLTAIPLKRRISGPDALRLIEANFMDRLVIVDLELRDYAAALRLSAGLGRVSGQVYDALHIETAKRSGCDCIFTFNHGHFSALARDSIRITVPGGELGFGKSMQI